METNPIPPRCAAVVGAAGSLVLGEIETPQPGPNEILIRVHASGINRADVYQSRGDYPPPPGASPILGLEVAGRVVKVGAAVTAFRVGDKVMALVTGGGYAQYCVAPAVTTFLIPERLDFFQGAAIPETYFTVWLNLFENGRLRPGEIVLIQGGTSGIGSAAIPIAKAMGAMVIATAGSAEKCETCRKLGADLAIDYRTEDFSEVARQFGARTGAPGVNVILDFIGAEYLERHLKLLRDGGRLVLIDNWNGAAGQVDLGRMISRNLSIAGAVLRRRTLEQKAPLAAALRRELIPRLESGALTPLVSHRFPAAKAGEAHGVMVESGHQGKIVLEW